jgi:putative ABC transport system ATP-binding protein
MLKIENVSKIYGKNDSVIRAVDNISISFNDGEYCVIIGKSGSGKTTLLNIIGGLLKPDSGKVFYNNKDIYSLGDKELSSIRRNDISVVFQSYNLIPDMTAKDNILLPTRLDRRKKDETFFDEITNELGIAERLSHKPSELSGGQQQRVAIARALLNRPSVILCDEPTGNLDEASSTDVIELLKHINEKYKTTIVMVTHDSSIAEDADRVIEIVDGKIAHIKS